MEGPEETFGGDGEPAPYEEMVSALAGGLYGELEQLVGAHGPGSVTGLLPQLVSVLESLQRACGQVHDRDRELERLREDRLRLLGQYERERAGRKQAEEHYMELEDTVEQDRKAHAGAVSRLEGQSRMLEGKARSYADQVASLEEQKSCLLKELSALTQTHSKMIQSYKELRSQQSVSIVIREMGLPPTRGNRNQSKSSIPPHQFLPSTLDPSPPKTQPLMEGPMETLVAPQPDEQPPGDTARNDCPLMEEIGSPQRADPPGQLLETIVASTPELGTDTALSSSPPSPSPQRNVASLYAEVSGLGPELLCDVDGGADLQGDALETLTMENAQLWETQLILDTARRHLIARVEELMGERESLQMDRDRATETVTRCQSQLREMERQLNRIQQELEETKHQSDDAEATGGTSRPQRFTRAEMARVVMERNLYKERLMELQEAVRRTELLRVSRDEQATQMKKSSFWKIFDRLFSPSESPEKVLTSSLGSRSEMGGNGVKTPPTLRYAPRPPSPTEPDSPQQQRRDLYHAIRSHIWQEHGRAQIHGWSQPPSWQGRDPSVGNNQVPVLTQLRLLDQKDPSTKLWCAAAAVARTGGSGDPDTMGSSGCSSSPALWVASGTPAASEISLLDAQSPNQLLQHFVLTGTHVLCLACLPGLAPPEGGGSNFEPEIVDNPLAPGPDNDGEATETGGVGTKPTLWLGTQEGSIYIHTAESDWRRCQKKVQLKDAIHSIIHAQGRAVAALGDGSLAIFHRDADCCWDLLHPRLVELGRPRCSVRCALPVSEQIWCGFRNRVYVVDPRVARIQRYFEVTPHAESQVRHMAASNTGVWVSVRLQATLRLLHVETGQPLQEVELVPFITRTLGPSSLALSLHISALGTFGNRLWVGTSGGIVIAVPFTQDVPGTSEPPSLTGAPPCCAMELAQISYHAHRDAVRFFISVPGCLNSLSAGSHENLHQDGLSQPSALVLSGGEGYINLRIGDNSDERYGDLLLANPRLRRAERSHLIVWQIQA